MAKYPADARPPCPYCGELQAYLEACPTKPRVVKQYRQKPIVEYGTECRNCHERIIWGFRYGNGSFAQLGSGKVVYSWSKP